MTSNNNTQSAYLPVFRARALNIAAQMVAPIELKKAIRAAVKDVSLPLFEVVKLDKKQAWRKFCARLMAAIRTNSGDTKEVSKILQELDNKLTGEF